MLKAMITDFFKEMQQEAATKTQAATAAATEHVSSLETAEEAHASVAEAAEAAEEAHVSEEAVVEAAQVDQAAASAVEDATRTTLSTLLSDSSDNLLVQVADQRDRSSSFLETPLRARLHTVTIMEVIRVSEDDTEEHPFRVLEERDGSLTVCHEASIDRPNWSTGAQVEFPPSSSLAEELACVRRSDVASVSEGAPSLSPMQVRPVHAPKRLFQTADITINGQRIKGLIKRRDQKK